MKNPITFGKDYGLYVKFKDINQTNSWKPPIGRVRVLRNHKFSNFKPGSRINSRFLYYDNRWRKVRHSRFRIQRS